MACRTGTRDGPPTHLKTRLTSLAFVLGVGFLLLISLVISAVLSALNGFFSQLFSSPWLLHILQVVNFVVSLGVITVLFAMLYRFLPDTEIAWHDVWIGAGMTALLFVVSKFLIGLYLGKSSIGSAYGPAGALVLILAWVYYASLVFLFGAEFTKVYAHCYGSRATSAAAPPLPQPRDHTPPVMPQGVRSVSSPGYRRYVIAVLSFVAGMVIGARRRAIFLTSLVLVLHKSRVRRRPMPLFRNKTQKPWSPQNEARLKRVRLLSRLLDEQFRIPGTTYRVGLDGLLGLIPGLAMLRVRSVRLYSV